MKRIIGIALLVIALGSNVFAAGVGVVDNIKLMNDYKEAVAAQKRLLSIRSELQSKIQTLQEQAIKDIEAAADDKAKAKVQQDAQTKFQAEKVRYESLTQSITKEIDDNIQAAINKVAKAKALDVVISKTNVYYGGKDITADVLKSLQGS